MVQFVHVIYEYTVQYITPECDRNLIIIIINMMIEIIFVEIIVMAMVPTMPPLLVVPSSARIVTMRIMISALGSMGTMHR